MPGKIRWGVLGTAKIAVEKVIPGMQKGQCSSIDAIASRNLDKAKDAAEKLGISKAYGSYEELLSDERIDAVYIPLPNHLHVPWTIRAAEAGKHVLCEKPIALDAEEAASLISVRDRYGVRIQEAFMVLAYPQWLKTRDLVQSGELGKVQIYQCGFSYYNADPESIGNSPRFGGGGLLDIGCYPIVTSRLVLGKEPKRVMAAIEFDPNYQVDRLVSAILDYGTAQAQFYCGTQMVPFQSVQILGSRARLELEIPYNAPADRPCRIFLSQGDLYEKDRITITIPECDQYTVQGDCFSQAILENRPQPIPLEDSIQNMKIIDAVFESARQGTWISLI